MDIWAGRVCRNCGTSRRYVSDGKCVNCEDSDARLKAVSANKELYHGTECPKCKGSARYTCNGWCYECKPDPTLPRKRTKQGKLTKDKLYKPAFMPFEDTTDDI